MQIIKSIKPLRQAIRRVKRADKTIGFVPTMGALHEGHLSLIRKAHKETDCVVVSIFVNPTQFDRRSDYRSYPRTLAQDARIAQGAGATLIFAPTNREMYPPDFQTFVEVESLSRPWEGLSRPGHFRGVTTIVTKLFHLVQPDIAYFGQKDAQQCRVVQQLIKDLNFDIRLRALPTVREREGLAMSSRNRLLSSSSRRPSRCLFHALQDARRLIEWGERRGYVVVRRMRQIIRREKGTKMDYVAIVNPKTLEPVEKLHGELQILLAVRVNSVRLIDNIRCYVPS